MESNSAHKGLSTRFDPESGPMSQDIVGQQMSVRKRLLRGNLEMNEPTVRAYANSVKGGHGKTSLLLLLATESSAC